MKIKLEQSLLALVALIIVAAFVLPHVSSASIANMTAQLGVYNSTDSQYGLEVDNGNNFVFAPTTASIKYPSNVATTSVTLTASNSGQVVVFTGTANDTTFSLPTAQVGMDMDIIAGAAKYVAIKPQSTDTIVFSTLTQGQTVTNSGSASIGDEFELFCAKANTWYVRNKTGTWANGT